MKKSLALLLVLVLIATSFVVIAKPAVSSLETVEDSWSTKTPLPQVVGEVRADVVNGQIHVIGGSVHYVYDPAKNDWIAKKSMPTARQYFGIAVCQNKIFTVGGGIWDPDIGWTTSNANEVYDPEIDSWETKTAMPTNRSDLCASIVDGKIYLIGGRTGGPSSIFALNEVYDVANDSWTTKKPMHYPVDSYASAVVDGKIYVMGGFEGLYHGVPVDFNQIYDPATDRWSLGASLPDIVRNVAAGATTGMLAPKRIYVIGGGQDMVATNITQVYDPKNDSWTFGAQMPTIRGWLAVAVVNDLLYAIGGAPFLMASFTAANEQYTPFGFGTPDRYSDGTTPEITLNSPENKTYQGTSVPLEFSSNEPLSWMSYRLDNEGITEIVGNTTLTGLSLGSHNLTLYAANEAGNAGASPIIYFTIQETEPVASPVVVVAAVSIAVIMAGAGLLVYFKKRKR